MAGREPVKLIVLAMIPPTPAASSGRVGRERRGQLIAERDRLMAKGASVSDKHRTRIGVAVQHRSRNRKAGRKSEWPAASTSRWRRVNVVCGRAGHVADGDLHV